MPTYRGHGYRIEWCNPEDEWGEMAGKFHIQHLAIDDSGSFDTYAEAVKVAEGRIDKFIETVPQTKEEWVEALTDCMVWTGYDYCELDETMVWELLLKASKHLKAEEDK